MLETMSRLAGQPVVTTLRSSRPLTAATTMGIRRVRTRPNIIVARASLARTAASRRHIVASRRHSAVTCRRDTVASRRRTAVICRRDRTCVATASTEVIHRTPIAASCHLTVVESSAAGEIQRIVVAAVGAIHRTSTIAGGVLGHAHRSEAFAALGNLLQFTDA